MLVYGAEQYVYSSALDYFGVQGLIKITKQYNHKMIKLPIRHPLMLFIWFMYVGIQQYKGQGNLDTNIVGDEVLTGVNFDFNSCAFTTFIYPL
jgi:hypothetical protein